MSYLMSQRAGPAGRLAIAGLLAIGLFVVTAGTPLTVRPLAAAETVSDDQPPEIKSPLGAYLAGLAATRSGDYSLAADYMLNALAADPDNPDLVRPVFMLVSGDGRHELSVKLARQVAAFDSNDSTANMVLAVDAALNADWDKALGFIDSLPERGVSSVSGPLLGGWLELARGSLEAAMGRIAPLKDNSGLVLIYYLHSALLNDLAGQTEAAAEAYDNALLATTRPTLRLVWLAGNFFERQGNGARAQQLYGDFARDSSNASIMQSLLVRAGSGQPPVAAVADARHGMAEVFFNIASLLSQERAQDLALINIHLALRLQPGLDVARVLLGEVLQEQGRGAAAIAAYRAVPADSPFDWMVRIRVADELDRMGNVEEALEELNRLAAERPDDYEAYYRKGNLLRIQERFDEAVAAYDEAVVRLGEVQAHHWSILYYRGIALERAKQWERAEADFLKALDLEPEQPFVMNYLAYSWVEQKQHLDEAKQMLVRAVELRPTDGYIVDSLGWVYYRLQEYQKAVEFLEKAVELRAQDPVINDHLGDALWRTNRRDEARFQWRRALSLEPEPDQVPLIENKLKTGLPDNPEDT